MGSTFNRKLESFGNIVGMEHTNVCIPDQHLATLFYIVGMGFTRDPYMVPGVVNMWVNIGRSQIHLPFNPKPQIIRGHTGLVIPDLNLQEETLKAVKDDLSGTKFDFNKSKDRLDVICPWGNEYRCYEPKPRFGPINLGMPYVEFNVPLGTAEGIVNFYQEIFSTPASLNITNASRAAHANVGYNQEMIFRETDATIPEYDGHHLQIYLADFFGPHQRLVEHGILSEESNQFQYRCIDIIDPSNGNKLFKIEHEIRSMSHPLYGRPFVNRNPIQTNRNYRPGHDSRSWTSAHEDPNFQLGGK